MGTSCGKADKFAWYDAQPHPNDPTLASTYPHHKHIPPNIKRNRILASNMSFTQPNLSSLIREIEELVRVARVRERCANPETDGLDLTIQAERAE